MSTSGVNKILKALSDLTEGAEELEQEVKKTVGPKVKGQWRVHSDQFIVFVPTDKNQRLLHLANKNGTILFQPEEK